MVSETDSDMGSHEVRILKTTNHFTEFVLVSNC